jgi:uncharacterized protein (TIGR02172 family)
MSAVASQYNSKIDGDVLTIGVEGKIDSTNSQEWGDFCKKACEQAHDSLVLDLGKLAYISSAGLRVVLALIKAETKPVKAVNLTPEVYEVLEMTGFTQMLDARKAMRQVSIEGCKKIGQGGIGSVYRLDKDTIIKVYRPQIPLSEVENERNFAQQTFLRGIPTAISYDIVMCGDCLGVVFEMLNADTVAAHILKNPDMLEYYTKEYAKMAKTVHKIDMKGTSLPDAQGRLKGLIQYGVMKHMLTEEKAAVCAALLNKIPARTTFVHGDFNSNNIMIQNEEILLIDMGSSGYGHPISDVAGIYLASAFFASNGMNMGDAFVGMTNVLSLDMAIKMWDLFIREYFGTDDQETLDKLLYQIETATLISLTMAMIMGAEMGLPEAFVAACKTFTDEKLFAHAEERIAAFDLDEKFWG